MTTSAQWWNSWRSGAARRPAGPGGELPGDLGVDAAGAGGPGLRLWAEGRANGPGH
jgi:hypothetical protein